jgi:hypothetical protein
MSETQVEVFRVLTPCSIVVGYHRFGSPFCWLHPEDGGNMDLRNVGIVPQHYMAQLRRLRLEYSPPWKPQISHMTYTLLFRTVVHNIRMRTPLKDACAIKQSRDSSGGIALGYGLDDRGSRVRFPAGAGNFSLHHRVQNGSGAHPASYPLGTRGSFLGGKAAGAWSWPITSI